ncbi:hypothetical protein FGB62_6g335 [Gracilaria domingensis]|nr:hypothetical protein FGB62_6g335 [Gracilaria domingensis]
MSCNASSVIRRHSDKLTDSRLEQAANARTPLSVRVGEHRNLNVAKVLANRAIWAQEREVIRLHMLISRLLLASGQLANCIYREVTVRTDDKLTQVRNTADERLEAGVGQARDAADVQRIQVGETAHSSREMRVQDRAVGALSAEAERMAGRLVAEVSIRRAVEAVERNRKRRDRRACARGGALREVDGKKRKPLDGSVGARAAAQTHRGRARQTGRSSAAARRPWRGGVCEHSAQRAGEGSRGGGGGGGGEGGGPGGGAQAGDYCCAPLKRRGGCTRNGGEQRPAVRSGARADIIGGAPGAARARIGRVQCLKICAIHGARAPRAARASAAAAPRSGHAARGAPSNAAPPARRLHADL